MLTTDEFLATHTVFTLTEAVQALAPKGGRAAVQERLKYAAGNGRIKTIVSGVYATVPYGVDQKTYQPDPYLTTLAVRPDAIFCYHSALDLLGTAYSSWRHVSVFTARRRTTVRLNDVEIWFLSHPVPLERAAKTELGVLSIRRMEKMLHYTGAERTIVEGFRTPRLVGGLRELLASISGLPVLDLELLLEVLETYDKRVLWGATGWFLETYRERFFVGEAILDQIEKRVPRSPQYLVATERGGRLMPRWNIIVPNDLINGREPDEP